MSLASQMNQLLVFFKTDESLNPAGVFQLNQTKII